MTKFRRRRRKVIRIIATCPSCRARELERTTAIAAGWKPDSFWQQLQRFWK